MSAPSETCRVAHHTLRLDFHDGTIEVDIAGSILPDALADACGSRNAILPALVARGPALGEGARPFTRIIGLADDPPQRATETQGVLQRLV